MNEKGIKWNEWNKKAEDHVGMQALSDTILLRVKWRMLLITWYKKIYLVCVCIYVLIPLEWEEIYLDIWFNIIYSNFIIHFMLVKYDDLYVNIYFNIIKIGNNILIVICFDWFDRF